MASTTSLLLTTALALSHDSTVVAHLLVKEEAPEYLDLEDFDFESVRRVSGPDEAHYEYYNVEDPEALNLDGSLYGVAVCRSSISNASWEFYAQGGGWCYDEADCWGRSKGALGSNKSWGDAAKQMGCNPMSPTNNAFFYYGDGASRSGYREEAWPVPTNNSQKLYFRGNRCLYAGIELLLKLGMSEATDVVFTGSSAGGLTVFLHLDAVAEFLSTKAPNALVVGKPICGYFADLYQKYPVEMAYVFHMQNTSGQLLPDCTKVHTGDDAWRCILAPYVAPLLKTPWFSVQSRFDWWQLLNVLTYPASSQDKLPCLPSAFRGWKYPNACPMEQIKVVQDYGPLFMEQFSPLMMKDNLNGGFLDQCLAHCSAFSTIDGDNNGGAFNKWHAGVKNVLKRPEEGTPTTDDESGDDFKRWWMYDCDGSDTAGPCAAHPPPHGGPMPGQGACFNIYNSSKINSTSMI